MFSVCEDNDGDGNVDFPEDPGCSGKTDSTEWPKPECSDGIDNDEDGDTDYGEDTDCYSRQASEGSYSYECNDGKDPGVKKGASFTCDVVVDGRQRQVLVVFQDDDGTYEVDRPR